MDDDTDWTLMDFRDPKAKEGAEQSASTLLATKTCPKCGRELRGRGAHFHIKACSGVE